METLHKPDSHEEMLATQEHETAEKAQGLKEQLDQFLAFMPIDKMNEVQRNSLFAAGEKLQLVLAAVSVGDLAFALVKTFNHEHGYVQAFGAMGAAYAAHTIGKLRKAAEARFATAGNK